MPRLTHALVPVFFLGFIVLFGCGGEQPAQKNDPAANANDQAGLGDVALVQPEPGKKDDEQPDPVKPPVKVVNLPAGDERLEKYEAALSEALGHLTERNYPQALVAFEAARTIQDTDFVKDEITRIKQRIEQDESAQSTVKNIQTVLEEGKASEASKLAEQALQEYGDRPEAKEIISLRVQSEAIQAVAKPEENDARFQRFKEEGAAALREKNLRAAALAYELALQAKKDDDTQRTLEELTGSLEKYDALRRKAAELRRDPQQLEDAIDSLREAAKTWDTLQVRQEIDECMLALQRRRDNVSVVDFETRGDLGVADAGRAFSEDLLPLLKPKFDLVERGQVEKVMEELKFEQGFVNDSNQQREVAKLAKVKYLVVGSVRRLAGVSVQARLVDARSGLIVQTAKVTAPTVEEALALAPELAKQLMMTDQEKQIYDFQQRERIAQRPAIQVVPDNAVVPPAPLPPVADAPPPPPAVEIFETPPPPLGGLKVEVFQNIPQPPAVGVVLVPPPPPPAQVQHRLLFASLNLGDVMFRAGRFREAHRHFEFALSLSPGHVDIALRLERCRPLLPPPPAPVVVLIEQPVFVARPRVAIMNFLVQGDPRVVPPQLSSWTPQQLDPYLRSRFDLVDPAEVYWYMARMGMTMRDLMDDPNARRWLGRAVNVQFFLLGSLVETNSFDVNTYLLEAEHGYLQGSARINVRNAAELRVRLGELAQQTLMTDAERRALLAQAQQYDALVLRGRQAMDGREFDVAVTVFEDALRLRPGTVQVEIFLNQSRSQARRIALELDRRRQWEGQQAFAAAAQRRQWELAQAAEAARQRAIAEAAIRADIEQRQREQYRFQAQALLVKQANISIQTKNFGISLNLFQGALGLAPAHHAAAPPPAMNNLFNDYAAARAEADRAARHREAELAAQREAQIRQQRERDLIVARQQVEAQRQRDREQLEAAQLLQAQRNEDAYQEAMKQGQRLLGVGNFDGALAAFQAAQRAKKTEAADRFIDNTLDRQMQARATSDAERQQLERRLANERERRRLAEQKAKHNEELYKIALLSAQKAVAEKNYDTAQTKYQEAGQLYKSDVVLTGLKQVTVARAQMEEETKKPNLELQRQQQIKSLYDDGSAALGAKDYTRALTSFQQARKLAPDNVEVLAGLSRAEQARSQLADDARRKAEDGQRKQAFDRLLASGKANLAGKQFDAAVANLGEAVKLNPTDASAAAALKQAEQARSALLADAQAQAEAKQRTDAYQKTMTAGRAALKAKRFDDAEKSFAAAQSLLPGDQASSGFVKETQTARKDAQDALRAAAEKRVADQARAADFQKKLTDGRSALALKDLAKAGTLLSQAAKLEPKNAEVQKALSDLEVVRGQLAAANAANQQAEQNYQNLLDAGRKALAAKQYPQALKALSSAASLRPDDKAGQALFRQAQVEAKQLDDQAARAKVQTLLASGQAALKANSLDAAFKAFDDAEDLEPTNPAVVKGLKDVAAARLASAEHQKLLAAVQTIIKSGQSMLAKKDYEDAAKAFNDALKLEPKNAQTTQLLQQALAGWNREKIADAEQAKKQSAYVAAVKSGQGMLAKRQYEDAARAFGEALRLVPKDAQATQLLQQANAAWNDAKTAAAGDLAKRQAAYQSAITSGQNLLAKKQYEDAAKSFSDALKAIPNDQKASQLLKQANAAWADAKEDAGDLAKKQAAYQSAIKTGQNLLAKKQYEDAAKSFGDALKLMPKDAQATKLLQQTNAAWADAKEDAGDLAKRQAAYQSAIKNGQSLMLKKDYDDAAKAFGEALKLMPNDKKATQLLQQANAAWKEAKEDAAGDLAKRQAAYQSTIKSGQNLLAKKQYEDAARAFGDALKLMPKDAQATKLLQQTNAAWNDAKKSTPPKTNVPTPYQKEMQEAAAFEKQNKLPDAVKAYSDALKLLPGDKLATAGLTRVQVASHVADGERFLNMKQFVEATREFESALKRSPNNAAVLKLLAKAKQGKN